MTNDEIIRIAKAVRLGEVDDDGDIWCSDGFYTEEIDSFAQLAYDAGRKAEREACAKVCEAEGERVDASWVSCAFAIRERGAP